MFDASTVGELIGLALEVAAVALAALVHRHVNRLRARRLARAGTRYGRWS